jgi:tetratricopeptide (TPR) repeat protein
MKYISVIVLCLAALTVSGQSLTPVAIMPGLSDLHHAVSTSTPEAQKFFDQGLRLVYAFNHDEASRAFHRAAEIDAHLAMAWWGVALANGPNYNLPVDPEHEKICADAIDKARALDASAPQIEKDYIEALARRFTHDTNPDYLRLGAAYAEAMRALARKYPHDADAATLFADSLMNLHPWKLYRSDGSPEPGTGEILATLEAVLRRNPNHIGAMHLYIHAVEASAHPERALPYADRIATLAPAAGHLVHMPAHIYERTGNYDGARVNNAMAAKADQAYAAATGSNGIYMTMYYSHNLHFGAIAAGMEGHCEDAVNFAEQLATKLRPMAKEMPMVEPFLGMPYAMAVRCGRWDELLVMPQPEAQTAGLKAYLLYGRGMALAAKGKLSAAEEARTQLAAVERATARDEIFMPPVENHTWQIVHIAGDMLAARIAAAKDDKTAAVQSLRDAVTVQDQLLYDEPPDWYFPVRESLGGMLLKSGDAPAAERVFREDLHRNPRNPRSLFGLAEALRRQNRQYEAGVAEKQFREEWRGADIQLRVDDL